MALKPTSSIFATIFQVPKLILQFATGSIIKDNGGVIQHRNSTDSAFVEAQGAAPTAGDSFVTKTYGDANYGPGTSAASVKTYELTGTNASVTGAATIPANAQVLWVEYVLTTALDGTTPTLSVGTTTSAAAFVASADVNVASPNYTDYKGAPISVGGSAVTPKVTLGGTGTTTGAWTVIIYYSETPAS
jgi:hypothetical protein